MSSLAQQHVNQNPGGLSGPQFDSIRRWLYQHTGIHLNDSKHTLVSGRLNKRLRDLGLQDYGSYLRLLADPHSDEQQVAINLLTTNETYFFREPKHFEFLQDRILNQPNTGRTEFRIWSAAASSGEEAYTIALVLAERLGLNGRWSILGTDINTDVLRQARRGIYAIGDAEKIPPNLLKAYCQKGRGRDAGLFRFSREIRAKLELRQHNLTLPMAHEARFDLVFLRNVLIYFNVPDKQKIVQNILQCLKPGGWLLVGHSESITGYDARLKQLQAGCYQFCPDEPKKSARAG